MGRLAQKVIHWQRIHGRHTLPWQTPATPYRVWISEIMLQQTRVETVIPYFLRFMDTFPELEALAMATRDQVLTLWSGLGYYNRARNLHQAAGLAIEQWGELPADLEKLQSLPGIGRSTAGAIVSLGFGRPAPILDGNVKRLFCRLFGIEGWPGGTKVQKQLWTLAERHLPHDECASYNQGLMDLGATLCRRKSTLCSQCPLATDCNALQHGLTDRLPTPRPTRTLPEKHCTLWWLERDGKLLLHRRPENGIWGGLWSLPQQGAHMQLPAWLQRQLPENSPVRLKLRHSFSHFHLHIRVRESTLAHLPRRLEPAWCWQPVEELEQLGLPAPIRSITRSLRKPS